MDVQMIGTVKRKKRRRTRTILISLFLFLSATAVTGIWYWNTHKNSIIKNKLEEAIAKSNEGFYKISYDEMNVNEDSGSLSVTNMFMEFDSLRYVIAEQNNEAPPMLFKIHIPQINVVGIKTKKALLDKEIVGRKVEIKSPVIDLDYTYKGKDSIRNVPTREIYQQVLGNLDLIQIDTILITGAEIRSRNHRTGKVIIDIKDITLSLLEVKVDSAAYLDSTRILFAKEINLALKKIGWASQDGFYNYTAKNITLNSATRNLHIQQFAILPTLGENAFVNAMPTQDDRFDFVFNDITVTDINTDKALNEYLQAGTMTISNASFKVYRDLERPRDKKNRVGDYPHQVMNKLPLQFNIRKVFVQNSFVEYKERNDITRQSGKVRFHNVNATLTNFTNDKRVATGQTMKAIVYSSFLNKTTLKTDWTFYLLDRKGRFNVSGVVGSMDATQLNPLAEPMGPASIKEGHLNGMEFNLEGNNYNMTGRVKVLYEDLKIALLEKDKGATETDKKFLSSLFANLIIKNSNPRGDDMIRTVQMNFSRDVNRSIFNLCWKTLFDGIRQTIGIKRK